MISRTDSTTAAQAGQIPTAQPQADLPQADLPQADLIQLADRAGDTCPEPVTVLSDLHLDWQDEWARKAQAMRELWAGSASVVFNGDTLNWYTAAQPERARQVLDYLSGLCRSDGAEPVFLAGNSDNPISRRRHLVLAQGLVLVTHGDVLFEDISPWRACAGEFFRERLAALEAMEPSRRQTIEGQMESVRHAIQEVQDRQCGGLEREILAGQVRERPWWADNPAGLGVLLRARRRMPQLAAEFAERFVPSAQVVLVGHAHRSGLWTRGGRMVVNTGSFGLMGSPLLVRLEDGLLAVREVSQKGGRWQCGHGAAMFSLRQAK